MDHPWVEHNMSKGLLSVVKGSRKAFMLLHKKDLVFTQLSSIHLSQVIGCQSHLRMSGVRLALENRAAMDLGSLLCFFLQLMT